MALQVPVALGATIFFSNQNERNIGLTPLTMKTKFYIIPGLGESCQLARYKYLEKILVTKGYDVFCVEPDWYKPLSKQVFKVSKNDIICGFSFGAVLAYLITKKYKCKMTFFASLSPIHKFSFKSLEKDFQKDVSGRVGKEKAISLGTKLARDIKNIDVSLEKLKTPYITMSGGLERGMPAKIRIPRTGHRMTRIYADTIAKIVTDL